MACEFQPSLDPCAGPKGAGTSGDPPLLRFSVWNPLSPQPPCADGPRQHRAAAL